MNTNFINYRLELPREIHFETPTPPAPAPAKTSSLWEQVNHFLSDPNDAPPYGYQDNAATGIGFWMMHGARFAISYHKSADSADSEMKKIIKKAFAVFIAFATLPLTLTGAVIKGVSSKFPNRVENLTIADIQKKTSPVQVDQIYDLLQIIDQQFRSSGISYSLDCGSLLGAVRHKGIIPWDDDGDLMMLDTFEPKFKALIPKLNEMGVEVQYSGLDTYKLTFDAATLKKRYNIPESEAANVDIFIMAKNPDGVIRIKSDFYKNQFPKEYFPPEEFHNLKDYPFGPPEKGLKLRGVAEPMRYLKTFYGPECFEYALQTHSHIQLGPTSFPILNFSKTRYKIVNPTYATGNVWKP